MPPYQKTFIYVGGAFLLVALAFVVGLGIGGETPATEPGASSTSSPTPDTTPTPNPGTVHIKDKEDFPGSAVTYTAQDFSPRTIKIKFNGSYDSCMVSVTNLTKEELVVRLSPHDPKDGWGFLYNPIPPNGSLILDPRYRIPKIAFHNHKNPAHEFIVDLDPKCLP